MSEGSEQGQPGLWAEGEGSARAPEPPESDPGPQPPARFQPVNRQQMVWRAVDVERLLEPDHRARAIWEMTGRLDLTSYTPEVRAESSQRRASQTDPEARVMKQGDGGYAPSHNVQISTDTAHAIIVGAGVTQEASDQQQLVPAVEEVQKQNGRAPGQMIVDEGYTTRENVLAADERGLDLIGSTMEKDAEAVRKGLEKRGLDPAFYPQNFRYDPETDSYTCPQGKRLSHRATRRRRVGVEHQVYQARAADCRDCALRSACKPGKQGRLIVCSENVPAVAAYRAKMQTAAARAAYRLRAPVAEFSNLGLKAKLGLRQFCVRGLQKARCEVLWACLTYNIQQWFRLRWKVPRNALAA